MTFEEWFAFRYEAAAARWPDLKLLLKNAWYAANKEATKLSEAEGDRLDGIGECHLASKCHDLSDAIRGAK